jgi:hypothetical protein
VVALVSAEDLLAMPVEVAEVADFAKRRTKRT